MRTLLSSVVGAIALLGTGAALAQSGNMMNGGAWGVGWMSGGYGGIWTMILLAVIVVVLVAWILKRGGK